MYHVLFVICIYIPISCIAFGIKYYYVMDSVLALGAVDRGFIIGCVMDSVLASGAVDRGFIGCVMDSVLASGVVDRGFESRSNQSKDY
jgi:hypothetical protein